MLKYEHVNVAVSRTNILNDINITFPKGQITTIIGPNGCGKTTLLQCLNGCSKVTAGTITVDNENILSLPLKERAKRIAFLPQIRTVIPVLPVRTLVEHGRFPYLGFTRRKTDKDNEIVNNSMEFTNVMPYSEDNTDTLSGGIRQRVFFSMILAQDSRIIIMDEPVTYLDLEGKRTFFSMVNKLKKSDKQHCIRVSKDAVILSKDKGLNAKRVAKVALLHDIGKAEYRINIVEKSILVILNKLSKGNLKRFDNIKSVDAYYNHAEKGANVLKQFNIYDKEFLDTVRYHHNKNVVGSKLLEVIRESDDRN